MILYKIDSKGKTRSLEIKAEDGRLYQISGLLDGAKVTHEKECKPKNVGKSNETTSITQAELEAKALVDKKLKSGYSLSKDILSDVLLPMKVKIYQEHVKKVSKDAYYSPKLNGVNGEFRIVDNELVLLSRGGDKYPMLEHLKIPVIEYLNSIDETSINVELYKHGWHLQDITAAVKKFKPDSHEFPSSQIEAHIFDIPSNSNKYIDRLRVINSVIPTSLLFIIPTYQFVDIEIFFEKCIKEGYEGIVIHNPNGLYEYNTRSSNVFKYKKALDGEYKVINYILDNQGNPTLILEVEKDKTFKVRPKGTLADREIILDNISNYIGKWYKIEYESLSKDNKPTKPVGIGLRDCDIYGNPIV